MKIAIVNQPFGTIPLPWTGSGGSIDIWTYEVARRLAKSCEVVVYTRKDKGQKELESDQNVRYRRISTTLDEWYPRISYILDKLKKISVTSSLARTMEHLFFFRDTKRPFFASPLYYLNYALQVAKDLKKENCDVVHLFNFSHFAPIIRAFNPRAKIVLNMRCEWLTVLDQRMIKKRLRYINLVIGCSKYIINSIRHHFPEFRGKCTLPIETNGVDVDVFSSKVDQDNMKHSKEKQLLFVGRISPEKGLHVLIDALQKVVEQYPEVRLKIVGPIKGGSLSRDFLLTLSDTKLVQKLSSFYDKNDTSYISYLQNQIHSLGIEDNVAFTGFVPNSQVLDYYQAADILVNPSFSESFGRSLIEAMACEVPVVATRIGGMLEIVENGKTGLLVEPGDASILSEAILCLFNDEELRKSMGKAARKRVIKFFSWEKVVENLLCEYKNIRDFNVCR
ncbi:MAG: glycosyltransferase family 4 protein [Candidatus Thermoplasmatota archaeon]|nr:glycosyltransferase family 4 protein [Candidatus Thermoplasmatota archaeon]